MWEKTTLLLPDPWRALRVFDHLSHGTVGPGRSGEVSASRRCALAGSVSHVFFLHMYMYVYSIYYMCIWLYIHFIFIFNIYDIYCIMYLHVYYMM